MPLRIVLVLIAACALVSLLLGALGGLRMRRVLESRSSRARTKRGLAAERAAERLLVRHGYRVIDRQVEGRYTLEAGDETWEVKLSADYLVAKNGRELLVEVKTGDAARLGHADTRRQMLEYQMAFGVPAIVLLDADTETLREVCFPLDSRPPRSSAPYWGIALAVAAAALAWLELR